MKVNSSFVLLVSGPEKWSLSHCKLISDEPAVLLLGRRCAGRMCYHEAVKTSIKTAGVKGSVGVFSLDNQSRVDLHDLVSDSRKSSESDQRFRRQVAEIKVI